MTRPIYKIIANYLNKTLKENTMYLYLRPLELKHPQINI